MRMKEKLPQNNIQYHLLMGSLDVSVSMHKLDDHFTVVWANDRYYAMFGYTKAEYEAAFRNRCDLFFKNDPEDWAALNKIVADTVKAGKRKYEAVCRMRHKNGKSCGSRSPLISPRNRSTARIFPTPS